ncbi:MAG: SGNH/GDSL hydrolase family protein [Paracoccaceae bacterium]
MQFILLPLLKWQGQRVRQKALKLPEAFGDRSGITGIGITLKILFVGDSSAYGVGVKNLKKSLSGHLLQNLKQRYKCHWKIVAKSGLTTNNLTDLILLEKDQKFSIAVISVGMNDVSSRSSVNKWHDNLQKLENALSKKFSIDYYIYSGMPPIHKLKSIPNPLKTILAIKALLFDKSIKIKCSKFKKYKYVNINNLSSGENMTAIDGFHPSESFYKIWSAEIAKKIEKMCDL